MFVESLSKIMPTFRAIVRQHHERRDGKFPVSIRVTHNRESVYIPTGLYIGKKQITKYGEIKDPFVIERTNQTIRQYEEKMLSLDTEDLREMPVRSIAAILTRSKAKVSYTAYCEKIIAQDAKKYASLKRALVLISKMGYGELMLQDVNRQFVERLREYIDTKQIPVKSYQREKNEKGDRTEVMPTKGYSAVAKNAFMCQLHLAYKRLVLELGDEAFNYTRTDPFVGYTFFKKDAPKKGSIQVEDLRKFFAYVPNTDKRRLAQDLAKLSFCLGGINIGDLLTMKKECYHDGYLTYYRHKVKDRRADRGKTSIKIQPEIADIVEKYRAKEGELLFNFDGMEFNDGASRNLCMTIYAICKVLGLPRYNFYLFRHTVASIARNKFRYSRDDVGMLLNHRGPTTVDDVYIDDDWSINDEINRKILDYVFGDA